MKTVNVRPGLKLIEESVYTPDSVDNVRAYEKEFRALDCERPSTAIGIAISEKGEERFPLVLFGCGSGTGLHDKAYVFRGDALYLVLGDRVAAVSTKTLNVLWLTKVDSVACFGLFWDEETERLIAWGELEISRISENGKIEWQVSGRDIFTGEFRVERGIAFAEDFEGTKYQIDLKQGAIKATDE